MIEKRAAELARELDAERTHSSTSNVPLHHHLSQQRGAAAAQASSNGGRGNISVQFFEKKRRKTWYMRAAYGGGDEEVCWECWTVKVTVAEPRTESGKECRSSLLLSFPQSKSGQIVTKKLYRYRTSRRPFN